MPAAPTRPDWFWNDEQYGGILCDIGSHQVDQFLYYTGSTQAEVVESQIANVRHPEPPHFQDFGDMVLRGDRGLGYVRLDWFTPDGLGTWGDGRLFILGTDGYIEVRKYTERRRQEAGQQPVRRRRQASPLHRLQQRARCPSARSLSPTSSTAPTSRRTRSSACWPPSCHQGAEERQAA